MTRLSVNIDHVATIREARKTNEPDPVAAAAISELAGAYGITIHLRGDRRHIQDKDVRWLAQTVKTKLNIEMAATDEMMRIARETSPDQVTLVPELPDEVTTTGGLDCLRNREGIGDAIRRLGEGGIAVSLFIDPSEEQIRSLSGPGRPDDRDQHRAVRGPQPAELSDRRGNARARGGSEGRRLWRLTRH